MGLTPRSMPSCHLRNWLCNIMQWKRGEGEKARSRGRGEREKRERGGGEERMEEDFGKLTFLLFVRNMSLDYSFHAMYLVGF